MKNRLVTALVVLSFFISAYFFGAAIVNVVLYMFQEVVYMNPELLS